jgi:cation diffusion facilitator CzcD-associated flavoprotein CzcO
MRPEDAPNVASSPESDQPSFWSNGQLTVRITHGNLSSDMTTALDVAILGAGPYGLATAAHLRSNGQLSTRVFGSPMSFWREMPAEMRLRSPYPACNIGAPAGMTLDDWRKSAGLPLEIPVPLAQFLEYGKWFQEHVAPDVDVRQIAEVASANGSGYRLRTADGAEVVARNVVVAAGIGTFGHVPAVFQGLPPTLAAHSSTVVDFSPYARKHVVVIGAGQSALEGAALLHEAGASVEVIARDQTIRWLSLRVQHKLGPLTRLLYAWPDVGPAGVSHLVARPTWWQRLPRRIQDRLGPRCIRPAGAGWLVPRTRGVKLTAGRSVVSAVAAGDGITLKLDDGSVREVDFVLLGTGYRVDVARYPFLPSSLLEQVRLVGGYPVLTPGFETSARGLYVLGAPAAWSFGPLMRFVAGSDFAARRAAAAILAAA